MKNQPRTVGDGEETDDDATAVFVFAFIGRFEGFEAEAAIVPCLKNSLSIKIVSRSGTLIRIFQRFSNLELNGIS